MSEPETAPGIDKEYESSLMFLAQENAADDCSAQALSTLERRWWRGVNAPGGQQQQQAHVPAAQKLGMTDRGSDEN